MYIAWLMILFCFLLLSACTHESGRHPKPHTHTFSEWVTVTAPTCTAQGKQERFCLCGERDVRAVDALGHTEVVHDATASSCTKWSATGSIYCAVCQLSLKQQEYISPVGHSYINDVCTVCSHIQPDYSDIQQYASHEGDAIFMSAANGDAMRGLYEEMERVLSVFHTGTEDAAYYTYNDELGNLYTAASFDYAKYGLSLEEAQTVYTIFRKDHPVYYWMSYWLYWNSCTITITTTEEYASGTSRQYYNEILYEGIEQYALLTDGEASAYNVALTLYDAILKNNSYAYTDNHTTEPAQWAHSVMGDFLYGKFVCEGYAKLFQILLNLNGIENKYVVGTAIESHCWNLVRMDDGDWYWFDLTWGDTTSNPYAYFCALDSALTTHTPTPAGTYGLYVNTDLPARANSPFACEDILEIGETFSVDHSQYFLSAANTVTLSSGPVIPAEKLVYRGIVYSITE